LSASSGYFICSNRGVARSARSWTLWANFSRGPASTFRDRIEEITAAPTTVQIHKAAE
jgi:hypothetical protein